MNTKKIILSIASLVVTMSLFLTGCATGTVNEGTQNVSGDPVNGGDFIIGSTGSPTIFNSLYSVDTTSSAIQGFLFNGLVKTNTSLEFEGDLAEDWDVSEDGLTWTFHLKEGVKFHDGEELTAEDVVFTYSIPLHDDYAGARASDFEQIKDIQAVDPYTVQITLTEKYAPFLSTMSYHILPKHILEDVPIGDLAEHPFNTKEPIGTGPFTFVEWKDGEYIKVEANEDYYDGRPNFDSIVYKIVPDANSLMVQLQTGDIHHIAVQSEDLMLAQDLEAQGLIQLQSGLGLSYTYIGWNQKNPLFQDKKVRQALTHALNREVIVESVLEGDGQLANSTASPVSWSYTEDVPVFDYDLEAAKALLAEAGWEDTDGDGILDKDGEKFEFTLNVNQGNKAREQIAVIAQEQLKEVGIEVNIKVLEWSAFVSANMAHEYDACINGWSLGVDPDQTDYFHSKHREQGLNYTQHSNPEVDQLLEENVKILDDEKRLEVLHELYQQISEDQPYTFLYYPNVHYALPINLGGFEFHPSNGFYNIKNWWLAE
ncbi:peptide-binding protein [Sutcliffiella sp. NC1]|uniref:peptide-binding protein n=1 Tax=Sutcliffiella sp. NC1 TaxID=3004096 RepID=UPI0022DD9A75|nr:peptide-binding protein [Sutcliffiella sp. NC1]WBL16754.1 peptide-binding protein [Sutcliffiella sp. NC1]